MLHVPIFTDGKSAQNKKGNVKELHLLNTWVQSPLIMWVLLSHFTDEDTELHGWWAAEPRFGLYHQEAEKPAMTSSAPSTAYPSTRALSFHQLPSTSYPGCIHEVR